MGFNKHKIYDLLINDINNIKAGQRLKEFRKDNKITQLKLAQILNTNQSVIANYERGRTVIATPFLYSICKKYNISADYLLGKIDSPKYLNLGLFLFSTQMSKCVIICRTLFLAFFGTILHNRSCYPVIGTPAFFL